MGNLTTKDELFSIVGLESNLKSIIKDLIEQNEKLTLKNRELSFENRDLVLRNRRQNEIIESYGIGVRS